MPQRLTENHIALSYISPFLSFFLFFLQHRKQSRYLGDEQAAWPHDITSLGKQEETRASCSHMRSIILRWGWGGKFSAISPLVQGSYWG